MADKETPEEPLPPKDEEPHPPESQEEGMIVKPHCQCSACDTWTNSADWCPPSALQFECKKQNVVKKEVRPVMRSEKHPGNTPKIHTYNPKGLTRVERQSLFKTLVHGEVIPDPVQIITNTYFTKDLQNRLAALNYHYSLPLQSFAWPAIFRLNNVFVIGGPKSGKTLSYLPVLCTFATTTENGSEALSKYKGPQVVIVCSHSRQCEEIYDLLKKLYENVKLRPNFTNVTFPLPKFLNSDIVITLPETLICCLKTRIFDFKRLCHLVFEDASTLLKNHESNVYKILEVVDEMLEHRYKAPNTHVQLIATSTKWTSDLKKLMKSMYTTPLVCIGNQLEAALYGNINFEIKFLMASQKLDYLECVLKDKFCHYKTVVICDQPEIVEVHKWLVRKGIYTLALSDVSSRETIEQYELEWNFTESGQHKVLLCTDVVFESLLCINSAMWLIHFSFPSTWTRFTKRFSALSAHYKSPLDPSKGEFQCKSFVLIDETCEREMSRILNLLSRLTKDLPANYQKYAESFRDKTENEKIAQRVDLCPGLKLFGKCQDSMCEKRHLVAPEIDVSDSLPKSGMVKFRILHLMDVTCYSVQLLEHVDLQGNVTKINDDDLRQPLNCDENVELTHPAEIQLWKCYVHCEYTPAGEVRTFCRVMNIKKNEVEVKLGTGLTMYTVQKKLFNLPGNLKIVDVYLSNLIPPFKDSFFSGRSFHMTLKSLQNIEYRKLIFTGRIHLQLDNTLWLDDVVQMFTIDGADVIRFNLIKHLTQLKVVEAGTSQVSSLHKLCTTCGITLPTYVKKGARNKRSTKDKEVEPQMAFLDDLSIHEVILSCAYSPDEFYVRLAKFQPLLENLEKEIQTVVEKDILDKNLEIEIGKYYLAPDRQGDTYARVKVMEVKNDQVLGYHVDYGDEHVVNVSTVKILPTRLLTKLPFQAIQCRLYGLRPAFGEWSDEATDMLYKYMFEPESDFFRSLFVEMRAKGDGDMERAKVKYSVSLKDGYDERQVLINQLLLDCGLATSIFDKIDDFEIPQPPVVEESSEEELDLSQDMREPMVGEDFDEERDGPPIDLEINNAEEFLKLLSGMEVNEFLNSKEFSAIMEEGENEIGETNAAEASKAGGPVGTKTEESGEKYLTPEVFWSQTEKTVRIKVKIVGVADYKANIVRGKIFTFSTTVDEKLYSLKFTLHERATLERHKAGGQEVVIVLNKIENGEWPQLTSSVKRMRNIHYEIPDEKEPPRRKFLQLDITDDESSSDDGIMYVQESDLESDFDYEQPNSDSDDY